MISLTEVLKINKQMSTLRHSFLGLIHYQICKLDREIISPGIGFDSSSVEHPY